MKGAKGWSDPPEPSADPGHPAGINQGTPELAQRERSGRNKETSWEKNRILHEEDTVGEKPQLISFSIAPAKLPDSSLLPRSRCGGTHSPAEYTDKAQQL